MANISTKNPGSVTDKLAGLPEKVTDLTFDEIRSVQSILWQSRLMHVLGDLMDEFKNGTVLNKWEIQAMEEIIKQYNIQYKSPLALALSETKEEK